MDVEMEDGRTVKPNTSCSHGRKKKFSKRSEVHRLACSAQHKVREDVMTVDEFDDTEGWTRPTGPGG